MAFGSLIGGLVTLIGTSPNILVSRVCAEVTGTPFAMFDFAPVGLGIVAAGQLRIETPAFNGQKREVWMYGSGTLKEIE